MGKDEGVLAGTSVVSRAWETARLMRKLKYDYEREPRGGGGEGGVWRPEVNVLVDPVVKVDPRVAFPVVQTASQRDGELPDKPVVRHAKIPELQRKSNKVCDASTRG